jgi:hypothetical protein
LTARNFPADRRSGVVSMAGIPGWKTLIQNPGEVTGNPGGMRKKN